MNPRLRVDGRVLEVASTLVMGVINVSPDSFSDARSLDSFDECVELAAALADAGADILDIGGESATTNRPATDADLEADRVVPIIEWVRGNLPGVLVSVDTYKPVVARAALQAGAHIVNDVSGLRYSDVASACAEFGAALVVMHTAAPSKVRLQDPSLYADVAGEVLSFLRERIDVAVSLGLPPDAVIVDPGPDFTKTPHQTVLLLRAISQVRRLGHPVLLALSRKDFLGAITGRTPRQRDAATAAAIAHLVTEPGNIVRVHDVAAAADVIATVDVLTGRRDLPVQYLLPDELRYEPRIASTNAGRPT